MTPDRFLALSGLLLLTSVASAERPATEHTFRLEDGEQRPAASLDEVAWLAGSWTGNAFGERFEEVWNPPSAGSMVGMFKLYDGDTVSFYEILLIVEEEDSLALRVKHFTPEFIAWEDKADYISFPLVRVDSDAVHFSGLSFYRRGTDDIDGYIVMKGESGIEEEALRYQRVPGH
ncbi:MAG: DUF6265 family protein [Pseudomonadota bacterium]